MTLQRPGEIPNQPGEYIEREPRGGQVRDPRQVTIKPGDSKLPPTQKPGYTWERKGPPKPRTACVHGREQPGRKHFTEGRTNELAGFLVN